MQGVLRNPLVSPYTLGLSSGASLGAAIAMVLGASVFGNMYVVAGKYIIVVNAFVFGSITTVSYTHLDVYKRQLVQRGQCDLLILDEALDACQLGLLDEPILADLICHKPAALELVVTGHKMCIRDRSPAASPMISFCGEIFR